MQPVDDSKRQMQIRLIIGWAVLAAIIGICLSLPSYTYSEKRLANKVLGTLYFPFLWNLHTRENLERDYKTIFSTPFQNVQVDEYTNSKVGHGLLFAMSLRSSSPLELKDPASYKTVGFDSPLAAYHNDDGSFAKNHAPWITTCLYKHRTAPNRVGFHGKLWDMKDGQLEDPDTAPYDVWVYLNQAKDTCEVEAR